MITITTSEDDAKYLAARKAVASLNGNISADKQHLATLMDVLENDPYGLTPQQVADGLYEKEPTAGLLLFIHIGLTIKSIAAVGEFAASDEPPREWLASMDGLPPVATQVSWSPAPLANGGVWPTRAEAIAESHALLAAWQAAHPGTANPAAFAGAL